MKAMVGLGDAAERRGVEALDGTQERVLRGADGRDLRLRFAVDR
jgi:hypothetical protein